MANLKLSHIYKVYENGHKAVNDFNIDIADKEFIVFVGPSGCGKSTTLRMIAGLENITSGDLFIGDTLANDLEPKDRDIAMVFQSYALYPHMTVYENMAFGLRNRHMPEDQIQKKVLEAAKMLDIEDYLDRKPKAMSGGQRQRVALGRALVRDPKVFLLDEPLSNLDAKLRAQMRTEITKLHKKLATTFIYVTHDQVEAMTMGTRIVVMKLGYVQQIDTPMNLYNKPYNKFVAGFIGTPQMNFFDVTLKREGDKVAITYPDGSVSKVNYEAVCKIHNRYLDGETKVILGIRPEHIALSEKATGLTATVNAVEHLGNECIVYGVLGQPSDDFSMKDEGKNVTIKTIEGVPVEVGDVVNLTISEDKLHLFDGESEITLLHPIPKFSLFEGEIKKEQLSIFGGQMALPEAIKAALGEEATKLELEIPPFAVVPGKDFTLKVKKVEEVEGQKLAYLENGDRYLFALVDDKVKAGANYSFALRNDKVRVLVDGQVVLEPVGEQEALEGQFKKRDVGRNRVEFDYLINGVAVNAPAECGYKINAVEGNACYKKTYRYVFDRKAVVLGEGKLQAKVEQVIDYGNQKYAKLLLGSQSILVEVPDDFAEEQVALQINGADLEVWQKEIDFRIC